jgi:hypothetical protein
MKKITSSHEITDLKIVVVSDADATVAVTSFEGKSYTASSKRCPGDRYDENIGFDLAVSRLLAKVSRALARQGNGAVKHADDVRRMRQERRDKHVAALRSQLEELRSSTQPQARHARTGQGGKFDWEEHVRAAAERNRKLRNEQERQDQPDRFFLRNWLLERLDAEESRLTAEEGL